MKEFKGTKGPWEWQNDESGYSWLGPKGCGLLNAVITDGSACGEYGPDIDVSGHDANIIAAAPDLLLCLQQIVSSAHRLGIVSDDDSGLSLEVSKAEFYIAKALGEAK